MTRPNALLVRIRRLDPMTVIGFLIPVFLAVLVGLIIHAHSKPIAAAVTQTTDASGGVVATSPANPPSAAEVSAANAAILSYCSNDLRSGTNCSLVANSDVTAPGFVESGLQESGQFSGPDESAGQGLALAKGSGSSWAVVWIGQNCIPQDVATQNSIPSSFTICSS